MNTSTTSRILSISPAHLHGLIEQALVDLRQARRVGDASGAARCERRMNALLDQLAKHLKPIEAAATGTESARRSQMGPRRW